MTEKMIKELTDFSRTISYTIIFEDLPGKIKEAVVPNLDEHYTIILDSHLSDGEQHKEFLHAIYHIYKDHFHSEKDVDEIESETHNLF